MQIYFSNCRQESCDSSNRRMKGTEAWTLGMSYDNKLAAVREYLQRYCVGWERRRMSRRIRAHLLRKHGIRFTREGFQRACSDLMKNEGLFVASDDHPKRGGMFIVQCRREADEYIAQLDRRADGTIRRRNIARELRDRLFPQRELVFRGKEG